MKSLQHRLDKLGYAVTESPVFAIVICGGGIEGPDPNRVATFVGKDRDLPRSGFDSEEAFDAAVAVKVAAIGAAS